MKEAIKAKNPRNLLGIPDNLVSLVIVNLEGLTDAEKIAKYINSRMCKRIKEVYYAPNEKARKFLLRFRENLCSSPNFKRSDFLDVPTKRHLTTTRILGADGIIKYNEVNGPYSLIFLATPLMAERYAKRFLNASWRHNMRKMPESALEFNFRTRMATSLPESILQYKRKT